MADERASELRFTVGEDPSPEFVANLRGLLLAESEAAVLDDPVMAVHLGPYRKEKAVKNTPRILAGVAAASIAVIVGFVALTGDGEEGTTETVDESEMAATTTQTATSESSTTAFPASITPAEFAADAQPLTREFSPIEAGTYRVDTVGTPFSLTIAEERFVQPNNSAFFVLTHLESVGPDDREIVFSRLMAFTDPSALDVHLTALGQGWPKDDFAGWLDNLDEAVIVTNRTDTSLGGHEAIRVDIELDERACDRGLEFCVGFFSNGLSDPKSFNVGAKYRLWIVDQGDEDPLAVVVGISRESHSDWFDVADGILATLAFGDPVANPILRAPAGQVDVSLLGGIRIDLERETTVSQDKDTFGRILQDDLGADAEFLTNPRDLDGNVVETTEDLLALLSANSVEVSELESMNVGGVVARVFGTVGGAPGPALLRGPSDERGWFPPPQGQLWLIEHPERGLLMVNAEAYGDVERAFPIIVAETEAIVASLEFIELQAS